jgi:hypothetical protein
VGHDKHSFSLVRRAALSRTEYSPRDFITQLFQIANDAGESQRNVPLDILEEAELWSKKSNAACDVRPQVPLVFCTKPLSSCAEGLAGVAASEDVHAVTKLCPREGLKIRPNRCWVHESRFHFCNQVRNCEGFDLTKSDCAQSWEDSLESKFNAAVSGTKAEVCNCFGSIHIMFLS